MALTRCACQPRSRRPRGSRFDLPNGRHIGYGELGLSDALSNPGRTTVLDDHFLGPSIARAKTGPWRGSAWEKSTYGFWEAETLSGAGAVFKLAFTCAPTRYTS